MSVNIYGIAGSYFTTLTGGGGFSSPSSPIDMGAFTTTVPLGSQPMLIVWGNYEGFDSGGAGVYTGSATFSWGNVPMNMFRFPQAIVSPPYSDTRSVLVGLLPFNASTVFADSHVRCSFTGNPVGFSLNGALAGIAQNVSPSSIFTNVVSKTLLDVQNPVSMTMPAVAGAAGDMIVGIMAPIVNQLSANWTTPAGSPAFTVETYTYSVFGDAFAYRALAASESDQIVFANTAMGGAGYTTTFFAIAFNLSSMHRRRWFWLLE